MTEPIYDADCGCCMKPETREKYEASLPTPETQRVEEQIDIAIANLVFSGLSIAQMDKVPDWLLENMEENKTKFKDDILTLLQETLGEGKEINSIFKE